MAIRSFGPAEVSSDEVLLDGGRGEAGIPFLTPASLLALVVVAFAGLTFQGGDAPALRDASVRPTVRVEASATGRFMHRVYLVDSEQLAREVWAEEARAALLWELTGAVRGHDFEVVDVSIPEGRTRAEHFMQRVLTVDGASLVLIDAHERLEQ